MICLNYLKDTVKLISGRAALVNPRTCMTALSFECFFPAEVKMASTPVETPEFIKKKSNGLRLVNWVNNLLKTNFKDVQQFGSGSLPAHI